MSSPSQRWLSLALQCLTTLSTRPNCVNVIVTQTQLVAALTKILLFGLGPIFNVENVYSAAKIGELPTYILYPLFFTHLHPYKCMV